MSRIRSIKPAFFKNEALAELPAITRLLFIGLWTLSDREGRLEERPKRIKAELFPYEDFDIVEALQSLHQAGFIHRYHADQLPYIQVVNFKKHQNPHVKEPASTIPAPGQHRASTGPAGQLQLQEQLQVWVGVGDSAPAHTTPTPPSFDKDEETAAWPTDDNLRERFSRVKKIPLDRYEGYLCDFLVEIRQREKPYANRDDLRNHFLNWSQIHHRAETAPPTGRNSKGGGEKGAPLDRAAITVQVGQIADRFTEKTWKWIFEGGGESGIRERAERAKNKARENFLTPPARTGAGPTSIANLLPA